MILGMAIGGSCLADRRRKHDCYWTLLQLGVDDDEQLVELRRQQDERRWCHWA